MQEALKTGRMKLSFEELAYTNMIVVEALVELLAETGVLDRGELEKRIKTLKQDTKVSFRPIQ